MGRWLKHACLQVTQQLTNATLTRLQATGSGLCLAWVTSPLALNCSNSLSREVEALVNGLADLHLVSLRVKPRRTDEVQLWYT